MNQPRRSPNKPLTPHPVPSFGSSSLTNVAVCPCSDVTAVCTEHADEQTIADLNTVDPERVQEFELDPCGQNVPLLHHGLQFGHGNCSAPDTCTCLCRSMAWYKKDGTLSEDPWKDPLGRELPPGM